MCNSDEEPRVLGLEDIGAVTVLARIQEKAMKTRAFKLRRYLYGEMLNCAQQAKKTSQEDKPGR